MPTAKRKDETDEQFISRCMSEIKSEFPDSAQRFAVCNSYKERGEKMSKDEVFVLMPRKKETRGAYLTRCSSNAKMKKQYTNLKERLGFCLSSFGEYYKYWAKLDSFAVPEDSALGACIAKKKAQGYDYKESYARCASSVVVQPGPIVLSEDLLVEPVAFSEMNVLGYNTKYFYICPGAQATFEHLMKMVSDDETAGMIRSAAQIADNIFEIEAKVLEDKKATPEQLREAEILVDDFYDLIHEIDEEVGMVHDVSYMEGHLDKISSFLNNSFAEIGPRGGIRESKKAPKSSTPNPDPKGEGTAKGDASGKRGAEVTAEQEKTLTQKVADFNERDSNIKNGKATLGALKSVFQRGLGAYNTSHSPNVSSSEQWAYARVNAFLYLLKNGRPENPKYTTDYDLLPKDHPKSK